jgi:hypothetical protein
MNWLFWAVCALSGHADVMKMKSTRRQTLYDGPDNGRPTGFEIVTEREFFQCKRCGHPVADIESSQRVYVTRAKEQV